MDSIKTTVMKITEIKNNPKNPRIIKDDKFKKLVESIQEFPEMLEAREIVVNTDNIILGGNMRFKAAKEAGLKEVPVKVVDWSVDKQQQFVIKDNVSGGEWDWDQLANEWDNDDLEAWGLDLPDSIDEPVEVEEDEAPEVSSEPPVSKLGEIYRLGRHRVMCGSATEASDVLELMDGKKADMVFTDPPYGVNFQSNMRTKRDKFDVLKNDDVFITEWIDPVMQVSNGFMFIWTSWKVLKQWLEFTEVIGDISNIVIWDKGGGGIGDLKKTFSSDYEVALVFHRGAELTGKRIGSVWSIGKDGSMTYAHPTQKPVELAVTAFNSTTNKGDIVLDVFGGSGSTLIAAEQTERTCYMMELDPKYTDVIRKRYHKFVTGSEEGWQAGTPAMKV